MKSTSGLLDMLLDMGVVSKGTNPGEKLSYVSEVNGERIVFREKDFDDVIARKLIQHPACKPILDRNPDTDPDPEQALVDEGDE
jgi:hypothetical protein